MKMDCLIGYTGFVGSNLLDQLNNDNIELFNRSNIKDIHGKHYDKIYCCGVPGVKYIANKNTNEDFKNILELGRDLADVSCNEFFLVSSQDCNSNLSSDELFTGFPPTAYGKNRLWFENCIRDLFSNVRIIRIGSLFGNNLRKNVIYDLLNNNYIEGITADYTMQLYNLDRLLSDFEFMSKFDIRLMNRFSEPVLLSEVIDIFNRNGYKYKISVPYREDKSYKNKGSLLPRDILLQELEDFIKRYLAHENRC